MQSPKVSVIIAHRNEFESLSHTLSSISQQSWSQWEVVIQDAKSDDRENFAHLWSDERIHFHSAVDHGIYDALNRAMAEATGDYYLFMGAGDILASKTVLSEMLAVVDEEADIIYGDVKYVNRISQKIPELHRGQFGSSLRWRNGLHHQGALYNRRCFSEWVYDVSLNVLADYDLNLRLWKQGAKASKWNGIVAQVDASGLSKRFDQALYQEERLIKKRWLSSGFYSLAAAFSWIKWLWKRNSSA